jgi:hypothetical protein
MKIANQLKDDNRLPISLRHKAIRMCKTCRLNSRLKKFPVADVNANDYIGDVKNRVAPEDESPEAGRFAMEIMELAPMETISYCSLENVSRQLSELNEEDRYSVIYEIARIQTLLSRVSTDCSRSAA